MSGVAELLDACREAINGLKREHNVDAEELWVCAEEWPQVTGMIVLDVPVVLRAYGRGSVSAHGRAGGFGFVFPAPIRGLQRWGAP